MIEQQPYIVCPTCGMVSHNPNDVTHRYCGHCHAFHDDLTNASVLSTGQQEGNA